MSAPVAIALKMLPHGVGLPLPAPATAQAAGVDLMAALPADEAITLAPGGRAAIPCGFSMALPSGFEAQVRPRSGLALKAGVTVLNAPGTVDADYRGEVKVVLINHGEAPFTVRRGDRIAQLVVAPVVSAQFVQVEELDATDRAEGGFGSTGVGR